MVGIRLMSSKHHHRLGFDVVAASMASRRVSSAGLQVGRIDGAHGDKNLVCSCPGIEDFR